MLRGCELTWLRCFLIALACQAFFAYSWVTHNFGSRSHEPEMGLILLYFLVPLVAAIIWQSWRVFLFAVLIPIVLVVGEATYFLIRQKMMGA